MKKHRKTVLAAIMLILVVASAVFAARVHTVSLDAENVAKITAKSTVTQAPPDEIVLTDSQCRELAGKFHIADLRGCHCKNTQPIIPQFSAMYKRSARFYTFVFGCHSLTKSMSSDDTVTVTRENAMRRNGM